MTQAGEQAFFVQSWMTRATFAIAGIQLLAAIVLALFARAIGVGPLLPSLFAFGAVLTGYQGYWTQKTPLAVVDGRGVTLRPALLASAQEFTFADVRGFAKIEPGWLVFLMRDGSESRVPLTALSESDAKALLEALHEHLTEMSYME